MPQGEVVENKRLSTAPGFIKAQQRERTEAKLAKSSTEAVPAESEERSEPQREPDS